jgi:broad specificity phosphatase PhoE
MEASIGPYGHGADLLDLAPLEGTPRGALVIRHAACSGGGEIARTEDALTPSGRGSAFQLGRRLRQYEILRLFASPIPRCQETAALIARGARLDAEVKVSSLLGKPGPFVVDEASVDRLLERMGLVPFAWSG